MKMFNFSCHLNFLSSCEVLLQNMHIFNCRLIYHMKKFDSDHTNLQETARHIIQHILKEKW